MGSPRIPARSIAAYRLQQKKRAPASASTLKRLLVIAAAVLGLWVWLFGSVIFDGRALAYRDVSHFYPPLFELVQHQWSAGRVPLWNSYDNLGSPLLADGTSSVFYPAKLLLSLPGGRARWFALYVAMHVLIASGGAFVLARCWKTSYEAAALAALSYGFGGSVLFQHSNLVFLIGAAWMPWGLCAAQRMLAQRRIAWACALGALLALMILGGDPQAAYHTLLLVLLGALFFRGGDRGDDSVGDGRTTGGSWRRGRACSWCRRPPTLLAMAMGCAVALSAIQVLPTAEYARRSSRRTYAAPRNLYETVDFLLTERPTHGGPPDWYAGLLDLERPQGSHAAGRYWFSVGPWRLIELAWPNVAGRQFPTHRRWLDLVPAEGELWVPSLYVGLLPFLLAWSALRFRRGPAEARWMTWSGSLAMLSAMGTFGGGWWLRQFEITASWFATATGLVAEPLGWEQTVSPVGDAVGGLYWWLGVALPGYVNFRYPAKWLVVASLALSMLAALGWDHVKAVDSTSLRRRAGWITAMSVAGFVGVLTIQPWWNGWMSRVRPDPLFGPLDAGGAYFDLLSGFISTVLIGGGLWWALGRRDLPCHRWFAPAAVLLTAIDLGVANHWMVPTAPAQLWQQPRAVATALGAKPRGGRELAPVRVFRPTDWLPGMWQRTSSEDRLAEIVAWQRDTIFPKFHLRPKIALAQNSGTLVPADFHELMAHRVNRREETISVHELLGTEWLVVPGDQQSGKVRIKRVRRPLPRAWVVHEVEVAAPLNSRLRASIAARTRRLFMSDGQPRDFLVSALVETDAELPPQSHPPAAVQNAGEDQPAVPVPKADSCRLAGYATDRVEVNVSLTRPGLLILNELYYPGWRAEVKTGERRATWKAEIFKTNRVMRGVWLPAGRHRVVFSYRPRSFLAGAAISLTSVVTLSLAAFGWFVHRRPWATRGARHAR